MNLSDEDEYAARPAVATASNAAHEASVLKGVSDCDEALELVLPLDEIADRFLQHDGFERKTDRDDLLDVANRLIIVDSFVIQFYLCWVTRVVFLLLRRLLVYVTS